MTDNKCYLQFTLHNGEQVGRVSTDIPCINLFFDIFHPYEALFVEDYGIASLYFYRKNFCLGEMESINRSPAIMKRLEEKETIRSSLCSDFFPN